jgi:hypothetical protein
MIDNGTNFDSYVGYGSNIQGNVTWDPANKPVIDVTAVSVTVYAYDVDYPSTGDEIDEVYLNGVFVGNLTGYTNTYGNTTFILTASQIDTIFGGATYPLTLTVDILVDTLTQGNWLVEVDKVWIDIDYDAAQLVDIDIKPWSDPNSINLRSKGVVPVAVLTTASFDATTVDPSTVEFAGAAPLRWSTHDVDGDGDLDLVFHFKTQELNLDGNSTDATLIGETFGGMPILGTDTVNIVPKNS